MPAITYRNIQFKEFGQLTRTPKGNKISTIEVDGTPHNSTERFITSLCANHSAFGLSPKLFNLFDPPEIFERLREKAGRSSIRVCIETNNDGSNTLLGVSNVNKDILTYENAENVISPVCDKKSYNNGIITSWHTPARMDELVIGPDKFTFHYVSETPIDGYGNPVCYLSFLRQVCSNGAIAYARAFRSEVKSGSKDNSPVFALERAYKTFQHEEGYDAITSRLKNAQKSYASCREVIDLTKIIHQAGKNGEIHNHGKTNGTLDTITNRIQAAGGPDANELTPSYNIIKKLDKAMGEPASLWGLAHLDALAYKKAQRLPVRATVYDLFNFATEVATHCTDHKSHAYRKLQAFVGTMMSSGEYDLELSKQETPDFADYLAIGV